MTPREGTAPQAGRHPKRRAATISPAPAGRTEVVVSVDPGRSFGSIESVLRVAPLRAELGLAQRLGLGPAPEQLRIEVHTRPDDAASLTGQRETSRLWSVDVGEAPVVADDRDSPGLLPPARDVRARSLCGGKGGGRCRQQEGEGEFLHGDSAADEDEG